MAPFKTSPQFKYHSSVSSRKGSIAMPSIKQAQIPPANLKDMTNLSTGESSPSRPQMPRPDSAESRTGLNSLAIGPSPSLLTTTFDTIRQWMRPGAPQFRVAPLPAKTNQQVGSVIQSTITQSAAAPSPAISGLNYRGQWQSF